MGTGSDAQNTRTLERAIFGPLFDAASAEEFAAVVTFHGVFENFKANSTNQRVFQLLVHDSIVYFVLIVPAWVVRSRVARIQKVSIHLI